jgi:hypothetical protein
VTPSQDAKDAVLCDYCAVALFPLLVLPCLIELNSDTHVSFALFLNFMSGAPFFCHCISILGVT